jgi:hypothetical protein
VEKPRKHFLCKAALKLVNALGVKLVNALGVKLVNALGIN